MGAGDRKKETGVCLVGSMIGLFLFVSISRREREKKKYFVPPPHPHPLFSFYVRIFNPIHQGFGKKMADGSFFFVLSAIHLGFAIS